MDIICSFSHNDTAVTFCEPKINRKTRNAELHVLEYRDGKEKREEAFFHFYGLKLAGEKIVTAQYSLPEFYGDDCVSSVR